MYQQKKNGSWLKHWDFVLIDIVCIAISYLLAYGLYNGTIRNIPQIYLTLGLLIEIFNLTIVFLTESHRGILRRGAISEFKKILFQMSVLEVAITTFLFVTKESATYSRTIILSFWSIVVILTYIVRLMYKRWLIRHIARKKDSVQLLIVTTEEFVKDSVETFTMQKYSDYLLQGVALMDSDSVGEERFGIPVVANRENILAYITANVVDEVFFNMSDDVEAEEKLAEQFLETGVTVHINLNRTKLDLPNKTIERMNEFTVVTSSIKVATARQLFLKRIIDIVGSLVGLVITAIAFVIFAPIIFIQSPGPIFFSQTRVGKGGRKFKIHKFRSMYVDAEERKKELMAQNKMSGLMFKMDNDPRIIPIGRFMRRYSIDELPQFFDVLIGNMSLVGTRPPTVDEYEQYQLHHKARLSIKPGITGMWQVSGRSDITDFEEVVKLDSKYISEWNLGMDIKILFRTIKVVFKKSGAV